MGSVRCRRLAPLEVWLSKLEQEHSALLTARTGGDELLSNLRAQLLALKERNEELERLRTEGTEAGIFYAAENARLHTELDALTRSAATADASAKLRAGHSAEHNAALERNVLELAAANALAKTEAANMRAEMNTLKAAFHRLQGEKENQAGEFAQREATWVQSQKQATESSTRNTSALHAQARKIDRLESSKSTLQDQISQLLTTLDTVAREMQMVERRVNELSKPSHDVYAQARPVAATFQEAAARRNTYESSEPMPPAAFFSELSATHRHVSRIMQRCLNETQKLHVGYSPAAAGLLRQQAMGHAATSRRHGHAEAVTAAATNIIPLSRPFTSPTRASNAGVFTSLTGVVEAFTDQMNSADQVSIHDGDDEEDEAAGENTLLIDPADSPVREVWLHPPSRLSMPAFAASETSNARIDEQRGTVPVRQQDQSQSASSHPAALRTPASTSSAEVHRPRSDSTCASHDSSRPSKPERPASTPRNRVAAPLISYDLQSIQPPASPSPFLLTAEMKRQSDAAREMKLLSLETQTQQRRIALRREKAELLP
jgi:uncharacterized protein (UPF0335 family)